MSNPTADDNTQIVRRLFEEGFNQHRADIIHGLVAADYVDIAGEKGRGALAQVMTRLHDAFPDIGYIVDDVVAESDKVAIRWHWTGTHQASFRGVAPTGRSLSVTGTGIFRLRNGAIVASAIETDRLGFLQGIGVVPGNDALFGPGPATASAATVRDK